MSYLDVYLQRCTEYNRTEIYGCIDRIFADLFGDISFQGKQVLLKPNLILGKAPDLCCSNPVVVTECARWFLDRGCRVLAGDSPAFGTARKVMAYRGMLDPLEELGVSCVDFTHTEKVELMPGCNVGLARQLFECDLFVNLPRLKTHNQMGLTFGVKNLFGLIKGFKKAFLHSSHGRDHLQFASLLLQLLEYLPENITLGDGVEAMHISGPVDGEGFSLGCMGVSASPVALDTAMIHLLQIQPGMVPVATRAIEEKVAGSDIADLNFPMCSPDQFSGEGFILPKELDPVRFSPMRIVKSVYKRSVALLQTAPR